MATDTFNPTHLTSMDPFAKGRILLVDENSRDLKYYRMVLESEGFEVTVCTSIEAGVQCLQQGAFDFVMVDQGTPAFEGRKVVDRAMEMNRFRPVLVVTACVDMRCYVEAIQMGALDYLEKPLAPSFLLRLVQSHVRQNHAKAQVM